MKTLVCVVAFGVATTECAAGFEGLEAGARPLALGSAFVGLANDSWAAAFNPAGIARLQFPSVSVFYSPQPFGVPELRSLSLSAAFPLSAVSLGGLVHQFGFELYRELSCLVSIASEISGIYTGVNIAYHSAAIARYGSAGTVGVDVGILAPVMTNFSLGFAARNINAPKIGEAGEPLPQVFTIGVSYQPTQDFGITADYQKELGFSPSSRVGFEYRVIPRVSLRAGISDEPSTYTAGLGVGYNLFEIDYAFRYHEELGMTHQFSLTLHWSKSDE